MRVSTLDAIDASLADPTEVVAAESTSIIDTRVVNSQAIDAPTHDILSDIPPTDSIDYIDRSTLAETRHGTDEASGDFSSEHALYGHANSDASGKLFSSDDSGAVHQLTSDDSFSSGNPMGLENSGDVFAEDNPNALTDGSDPTAGVSTGSHELTIDVSNLPADANSVGFDTSSTISDIGSAHFNSIDVKEASDGTPPTASSTIDVPVYNGVTFGPSAEAGSYVAPSSEAGPANSQSDAPILAFTGDLGSGVGELTPGASGTGAGSGSGSGSGGTVQSGGASAGLVININWDSSVANAPTGFTAAVEQVVSFYESHFTNPIAITIDVGYGEVDGYSLGSGDLGESETYLTSVSYSQLESALVKNADAFGDTAAAASLPATSPVSGQYWVPVAEATALGLFSASGAVDGYVGFSSSYNFAYNDSNGVGANQFDFFGTVAHEISEVMGRQMMDGENFSGSAGYEPLDLFHYSASGVRDFSGTTAGYLSADGGATNLGNFNTNSSGDFGDWAGSVGANSYLAFSSPGVVNAVTANDLTEMNLLGWAPASSGSSPVVTVALAHDTGSNNVTSNDALTGTADANATVTLTEGSTVLGSTTANASGVWAFTPTGLAQGSQTITASETNAAGLTGSSSLTFTYDTAAPTVTVALAHDTGSNNVTSNDALTGTADANATVTLTEGSTVLGSTTANASGVWAFTPTGLAQGSQTITASETNAAGLTGSSSLTFTYDTAAPTVTVALAHDTGSNNVTSNDALTGTADANATVTLTEGSTVLGSTTANASGVWAFTPTGLAQGSQTITASETNAAGLTGSSSLTFTYDTAAPTVTVALAHDTGSNNVTSNDALTGTADANATVTLTEGSTVLGSTTANASGVWAFTPTGLAQGSQTITASETNAAGLTGSSSLTFTYDTAAPTVTVALAHDTGSNNVTSNDALTGTADANATVTLTEGSTVLGSTTANASGVWAFTPTGLAQGSQTITASETNAAGLTGSSSLTFTYDTAAPTVTSDTISGTGISGGAGMLTAGQTAVLTLGLSRGCYRCRRHAGVAAQQRWRWNLRCRSFDCDLTRVRLHGCGRSKHKFACRDRCQSGRSERNRPCR